MSRISWTDTHCHLDFPASDRHAAEDRVATEDLVAGARAAGVTTMVSVGCDADSSRRAIELASRFDDVWASVGLHPHEATLGVDSIVPLIASARVVAIGEAGLDYFYDHSPRDVQRAAFADQIQLAHEHDLPLIIHTRDAWEDTFAILDAEGVPARTVFHCFTGGPAELSRCIDRGAFVSFSGIVTFKAAVDVAAAAVACPADRLLIETDSPYLAPVPERGRVNRPEFVVHVGHHLATLRSTSPDDIAAQTSQNARIAFPRLAS